ncbi:MAG: hypothetical protein JM58_15080 [Peptococcaceae bacterium BICA1-8]|nr:MAG: hypothetical protein JM58_15080 [Peptococcaceae bacterium BICA1-8]
MILLALTIFVLVNDTLAFGVYIDEEFLGTTDNQIFVENLVKDIISEHEPYSSQGLNHDNLNIEFKKMRDNSPTPPEKLKEILEQKLSITLGAAVIVNGIQEVVLMNSEGAEDVLAKIKEDAIPSEIFEVIKKVEINESLEIIPVEVPFEQILTIETAYQLLKLGSADYNTYIVKEGDSLWQVAHDNNLEVGDLKQLNTELKSDLIKPGQELSVISMEPKINVAVEGIERKTENIPFEVKYINDDKVDAGTTKIKQEGISGKQEITYLTKVINGKILEQNLIDKKVLEEPVSKIIIRGIRRVSRDRAKGQYPWPVQGKITSLFGNRKSPFSRKQEFHRGIDIAAPTGTSINAIAAGTVTYAGWRGNYGNQVEIDHGQGFVTRYSHASKIDVKVGQKVKQGQVIALVGSTGRSTGPHVDLETIVNGQPRNPLEYIR